MIQSLIWRIRWTFDKRWRESTIKRVRKAECKAAANVTLFRMTALRRFVMGRLG